MARGCLTLEDGSVGDACLGSGGSSNQTHPGGVCDPSVVVEEPRNADGASR